MNVLIIIKKVPFQESVKIYDYKNRLAGTMNVIMKTIKIKSIQFILKKKTDSISSM